MYCLRCGKDTKDEHVFCDGCLLLMEAYPVKPGTAIHLPSWKRTVEQKKQPARKKALSQAEQLARAKELNRWLCATVLVLTGVLCATVLILL